jgi:hypothetical protein
MHGAATVSMDLRVEIEQLQNSPTLRNEVYGSRES